jgi:hypothetical protein
MQAQAHKLSEQSLSAALHAAQLQCTVLREDAATSFYGASHLADVTTAAGAAAGGAETVRAKLLASVKARTATAVNSTGIGAVYTHTGSNKHSASKHSSNTARHSSNNSDDNCKGISSSHSANCSAVGSSSVRTKRSTRVHRSAVRHSSSSNSSSSANNCSDGTGAASDDVCDDVCADVAAAESTRTGRASTRKQQQQQHSPAQQRQREVKAALQSSVALLRAANSAVDSRDTQDYSDQVCERASDLLLTVAGSSAVKETMRSSGGRQSASLQSDSTSAAGAAAAHVTTPGAETAQSQQQQQQQQQQQSTQSFELRNDAVVSERSSSNSADAHEAVPPGTLCTSSRDSNTTEQATIAPTSRSNTVQDSTSGSSDVAADVTAVPRHSSRSAALTGKCSNLFVT